MRNKNCVTALSPQNLNSEYNLFRNLTNNFCCSLERFSNFFEQLSEEQKSRTLKEIENTQENISAINRLLGYKGNTHQAKND